MSELLVIGYGDKYKADEVRLALVRMQKDHLVDLEDAAVASRDEAGKIKLRQMYHLANTTTAGIVGGGFWGLLVGALLATPALGTAVGAAAGGVAASLADVGISDKFIKELSGTLLPGSSALFVLVRKAPPERVIEEIRPYGGRVLRTSLTKEDENALQHALDDAEQTVGSKQ